nr:MAG TPA: hypothetical protein [Caudoviricetes sp.]
MRLYLIILTPPRSTLFFYYNNIFIHYFSMCNMHKNCF